MSTQGLLLNVSLLTEQQLVDLYQKAYCLLMEGKTIMEFSGQGSEFKSEFPIPVEQMLSECNYALKQKNPGKYGNIVTSVKPFFI